MSAHEPDRELPQLAERARAGEAEAQGLLWARSRRWLASCLLAHGVRHAEVEDRMQEVALRLVSGISSLRDPARVAAWLRSLARNVARAAARREAGRGVSSLAELGEDPAAPAEARDRRAAEELEETLARVHALPEEYREPLLLRGVGGLSQRAIAEALELPETTVETRLARGRRMLRARVADAGAPLRRLAGGGGA